MKKVILSISLAFYALASVAATLSPIQLLNPAGSTSGQVVLSNGPVTAPGWGNIAGTSLAAQAANTVLANASAVAASPTAFAMPSCNSSTSALQWTSGTGFTCYANSASTTGAAFTGAISAPGVTTTANFLGAGTGYSIGNTTGLTSGGAIQLFDATHGNNISVLIGAIPVANFTSTGINTTAIAASSTITPSQTAGIVGTTTNNNANAGSVGEYICAQVTSGGSPTGCATNSSTPVSLTTGIAANVTSISLTPGDWDVRGNVEFSPAGTTNQVGSIATINTVSATLPTQPNNGAFAFINVTLPAGQGIALPTGTIRISVSTATTVYLIAQAAFNTSTDTAFGFIGARRIR